MCKASGEQSMLADAYLDSHGCPTQSTCLDAGHVSPLQALYFNRMPDEYHVLHHMPLNAYDCID